MRGARAGAQVNSLLGDKLTAFVPRTEQPSEKTDFELVSWLVLISRK